jgi:hypothetical protein
MVVHTFVAINQPKYRDENFIHTPIIAKLKVQWLLKVLTSYITTLG